MLRFLFFTYICFVLKLKEHITLFCLVVLLIPSVLQTIHAFEDHSHNFCSSLDEHHFHEQEIDCSLWHFHSEIFSYNHVNDFDIAFEQSHQLIIEQAKNVTVLDNAKKSPRAPPALQ